MEGNQDFVPPVQKEVKDYLLGARNAEEVYLRLLGENSVPESPKEMPQEIFLPGEFLGTFEKAIFETVQDGKERSQQIYYYSKQQQLRYGNVFTGTSTHSSTRDMLLTIASSMFLDKRMIAHYHTHPFDVGEFSDADMRPMMVTNRGPFIQLVGSSRGVQAALHTKESRSFPISSSIRTLFKLWKAERKIRRVPFIRTDNHQQDLQTWFDNKAPVFEKETGLVLYSWKPEVSPDSEKGGHGSIVIKRGELTNGIHLLRSTHNPFMYLGI